MEKHWPVPVYEEKQPISQNVNLLNKKVLECMLEVVRIQIDLGDRVEKLTLEIKKLKRSKGVC